MSVLKDIEGKTEINLKDKEGKIIVKEIKFDYEAICFVEEETGMEFIKFTNSIAKSKSIFSDIKTLITAGLQHEKEYTTKEVGKMLLTEEVGNYTEAIGASIKKHMIPAS